MFGQTRLGFRIGRLCIQYHRMPKYLGKLRTSAPSHLRVFLFDKTGEGAKFLFDIPMPKYGRE